MGSSLGPTGRPRKFNGRTGLMSTRASRPSADGHGRRGIVRAGKAGTAIARAAVAGGYNVAISGSGPAERIELVIEVLAAGAHAVGTDEVGKYADLIVLAIPMHRFRQLRRELFAG